MMKSLRMTQVLGAALLAMSVACGGAPGEKVHGEQSAALSIGAVDVLSYEEETRSLSMSQKDLEDLKRLVEVDAVEVEVNGQPMKLEGGRVYLSALLDAERPPRVSVRVGDTTVALDALRWRHGEMPEDVPDGWAEAVVGTRAP